MVRSTTGPRGHACDLPPPSGPPRLNGRNEGRQGLLVPCILPHKESVRSSSDAMKPAHASDTWSALMTLDLTRTGC